MVNADDPWTPRLLKDAACRVMTYAERAEADLRAEHMALPADGIAFDAVTKTERVPVSVHIPGGFMVYNTLDVLGAALALEIPLKDSATVLAGVPHMQGRVEVIPTPGKDGTIVIDYATRRTAWSTSCGQWICQGPRRSGDRLRRRPSGRSDL
ncbi:MAG: Mur ligase family protein [Oscillospiraceae bacterium]